MPKKKKSAKKTQANRVVRKERSIHNTHLLLSERTWKGLKAKAKARGTSVTECVTVAVKSYFGV